MTDIILDKWNAFKETVGPEYALAELERSLGTWLLAEHAEFIIRMNDCDCFAQEDEEDGF